MQKKCHSWENAEISKKTQLSENPPWIQKDPQGGGKRDYGPFMAGINIGKNHGEL